MILEKLFLDNVGLYVEGKQKFIYQLSPYRSILLICDKNCKPLAKYCLVNRIFSPLSEGEDLNDYSELLYTFVRKRSHH